MHAVTAQSNPGMTVFIAHVTLEGRRNQNGSSLAFKGECVAMSDQDHLRIRLGYNACCDCTVQSWNDSLYCTCHTRRQKEPEWQQSSFPCVVLSLSGV